MNRREALSSVALLFGGTIIGADAFLYGCTSKKEGNVLALGTSELILLDEIGETILPATASSPGAKEARVAMFMQAMINDCYSEEERKVFLEGISKFRESCDNKYGKDFMELETSDRHNLLLDLETEANVENDKPHYYTMIKQLTILGYLTSEIGATQAMRHVAVPGRYDACIDHKEGEKAWA